MWFADAPAPARSLGTAPLAIDRFVAEPNDGAHVWALAGQPVAHQQIDYDAEFQVMPDVLLQAEGYRLGAIAGVVLPPELTSVLGQGPEILDSTTHPMRPALLTVAGERLLALTRSFGSLDVHVGLCHDQWILAICPSATKPVIEPLPAAAPA
jgi:hypothetical protein